MITIVLFLSFSLRNSLHNFVPVSGTMRAASRKNCGARVLRCVLLAAYATVSVAYPTESRFGCGDVRTIGTSSLSTFMVRSPRRYLWAELVGH